MCIAHGGIRSRRARPDLRFKLSDTLLQPMNRALHVFNGHELRDVLRAIAVPCLEFEDNDAFRAHRSDRRAQPAQQFFVILDDLGTAPEFDPSPARIVHEKDEGERVLREIAGRDVLLKYRFQIVERVLQPKYLIDTLRQR